MTDEQMMALAQTYQTPMHIFDMAILKKRVAFLKSHLPEEVSLCYAVKANTFIIKELCGQVERFEVCSQGNWQSAVVCRSRCARWFYPVYIRHRQLWRLFSGTV